MQQNGELFERLNNANSVIANLERDLKERDAELESLCMQVTELRRELALRTESDAFNTESEDEVIAVQEQNTTDDAAVTEPATDKVLMPVNEPATPQISKNTTPVVKNDVSPIFSPAPMPVYRPSPDSVINPVPAPSVTPPQNNHLVNNLKPPVIPVTVPEEKNVVNPTPPSFSEPVMFSVNDNIAPIDEQEESASDLKPMSEPAETVQLPPLDECIEYGSQIIGKIVVSAARYSNLLTAGGETRYKELLNLILGRTEVAKSEILDITVCDAELSVKKHMIDDVYEQALEYFESVMAQI